MPKPDPRSDKALIEAANEGDASAFETLYYRYRDWVAGLAYRFTGHRDDALDVLQDMFVYLLKKFPGFHLTASMTTFLYPVVKNLSISAGRKRRRFSVGDEILADTAAPEPQPKGASRSELAVVMRSLPESQREVLLMRFVDAMSLREIAEALNIPVGTVKSRLHNALKTLRDDERTRRYFAE